MNQVMPVPLGLTHWFHHWQAKVLSVRCSDAGSLCGLMAFDGRTSTTSGDVDEENYDHGDDDHHHHHHEHEHVDADVDGDVHDY